MKSFCFLQSRYRELRIKQTFIERTNKIDCHCYFSLPLSLTLYCYGVDSTKLRNGEDYIQLEKVYFS